MVNTLGTPCCNTLLVFVLLKQITFKLFLKQVKDGVFMMLSAVYMYPVECMYVYVVGGLASFDIPFKRLNINCIQHNVCFTCFKNSLNVICFNHIKYNNVLQQAVPKILTTTPSVFTYAD